MFKFISRPLNPQKKPVPKLYEIWRAQGFLWTILRTEKYRSAVGIQTVDSPGGSLFIMPDALQDNQKVY